MYVILSHFSLATAYPPTLFCFNYKFHYQLDDHRHTTVTRLKSIRLKTAPLHVLWTDIRVTSQIPDPTLTKDTQQAAYRNLEPNIHYHRMVSINGISIIMECKKQCNVLTIK